MPLSDLKSYVRSWGRFGLALLTGLLVLTLPVLPTLGSSLTSTEVTQVLTEITDDLIQPSYTQLAEQMTTLSQRLDQFSQTPNPTTLRAAQQALMTAHDTWLISGSLVLGPVNFLHFGQALYPGTVDESHLEAILAGQDPLTLAKVHSFQNEVKGLSTVEHLLAGVNSPEDLAERERTYLALVGQDLTQTVQTLIDTWQNGIDGYPAYRTLIVTAGDPSQSSPYALAHLPLLELLQGSVGTLEEEVPEALRSEEDPSLVLEQAEVAAVRARVQGLQAVYLGSWDPQQPGQGLKSLIVKMDPDVEGAVTQAFTTSLADLDTLMTKLAEPLPAKADSVIKSRESLTQLIEVMSNTVVPMFEEMAV